MSNDLTYPFKTMRLTQGYSDGNHKPHSTGSPKDYPLDEAGADGGRDYFYAPCDVKVARLYGDDKVGRHIWLQSTARVTLANGKSDYVTIFAVHLNYDDYSKLKEGQTFKQGAAIFREGNSGNSSGNHIHMAIGLGLGREFVKNNQGVYVLKTPNGAIKPEDAFMIDPAFTKILNGKGVKFKELPAEKGNDDMSRGYFKKGDKNEGVYALKQMLITLKSMGVIQTSVDDNNDFGSGTEKAVIEVQKAAKITQDGCAGVITLKVCRALICDGVLKLNSKLADIRKLAS